MRKIVLDTNVVVAAMASSSGASHKLLLDADKGDFQLIISTPLISEYEDVVFRKNSPILIRKESRDVILDWICKVGVHQKIYYLWRPYLRDSKDDMVLETAMAGGAEYIVTFNSRDFIEVDKLGIKVISPSELLKKL